MTARRGRPRRGSRRRPPGYDARTDPRLLERSVPDDLADMTDLTVDLPAIDPAAPQYNARLVRREDETESLAYFWVRFDGEPTPFEPGQYMTIGVMVDGKIVQRPYSVASPPARAGTDGYEFYVRLGSRAGRSRRCCGDLPVGHGMRMIGPKGKFMLLPDDDRTHIFISSGTGNAPFVSMMRQLLLDGAPRRAVMLNGVSHVRRARLPRRCSRAGRRRGEYPVTFVPTVSRPNDPANAGWTGRTGPGGVDPRPRSSTSSA